MKIIYWPKIQLGRPQITESLMAVDGVELQVVDTLEALLSSLAGVDGLVLADAPPNEARQVIDALNAPTNTVKWMHFISAGREGFEQIGLPSHIQVTYAAGAASPAVAEHAMMLLLAMGRRVADVLSQQAQRKWDRMGPGAKSWSLEGKRLAIVGYGQIGEEVAKRAKAFGARILAVSRKAPSGPNVDEGYSLIELDTVLAQADAVVVSIALTAQTSHMFNARAFSIMKKGAYFVNVARGGVVDQAALKAALVSGHLAGAGVDVVDPEPMPADDPLWDSPNLILSPHFAGAGSQETVKRLAAGAAGNARRLVAGEPLKDVVSV